MPAEQGEQMSKKRSRGARRLGVALASAVAALGVSGVAAGSASAADATFDNGYLKISLPGALQIIENDGMGGDDTGPVKFNNFTTDVGGNYTVPNADVVFPAFSGSLSGIPLTVDVDLNSSNLTGNL